MVLRFVFSQEVAAVSGGQARLRTLAVVIVISLIVGGVIGVLSAVVGLIDMGVRRTVSGTVVQVNDRKTFDFLPAIAQRILFERNANELDRRKVRTEVVLNTETGFQQWTVRKLAVIRGVNPGTQVTLTVTPIAGYVADIAQGPYQTPVKP